MKFLVWFVLGYAYEREHDSPLEAAEYHLKGLVQRHKIKKSYKLKIRVADLSFNLGPWEFEATCQSNGKRTLKECHPYAKSPNKGIIPPQLERFIDNKILKLQYENLSRLGEDLLYGDGDGDGNTLKGIM